MRGSLAVQPFDILLGSGTLLPGTCTPSEEQDRHCRRRQSQSPASECPSRFASARTIRDHLRRDQLTWRTTGLRETAGPSQSWRSVRVRSAPGCGRSQEPLPLPPPNTHTIPITDTSMLIRFHANTDTPGMLVESLTETEHAAIAEAHTPHEGRILRMRRR